MRRIPAAAIFAAGVLFPALAVFLNFPWFGVLASVWVPLGAAAVPTVTRFSRVREPLRFAVFALGLAAASAGGLAAALRASGDFVAALRPGGVYGGATVRVTDRTLPRLEYDASGVAVQAELETFRPEGEPEGPAHGTVRLRLAPRHPRPGYGDRLRITGLFAPAEPGDGLFDYPVHLRHRGIDATVRADACERLEPRPDRFSPVLKIRDRLLARAWRGVPGPELRSTVSRLFFGCRPEPDARTRTQLVYAGVIHLYCVSGLHVMMLAGLVLLALFPFPAWARYPLMLAAVGLYVLTCGAGVAAVRAWILLTAFCAGRLMFRTEPPLRILVFTGGAMTAANPYNLGDPGFWYSFTVTGMLLALPRPLGELRKRYGEIALWHGFRDEPPAGIRFRLAAAGITCVAAFLAGAGFSLYFQGWLLPGSVAANLCTLPLVAVLFPLLGLKLIFPATAELLNDALRALDGVAGAAAQIPALPAVRPAWWAAALFYAGLFTLLRARTPGWRRAGGAVTALVLAGCVIPAFFREPLRAAGVDNGVPFAVQSDPLTGHTTVWNVPGFRSASAIRKLLAENGITVIDRLAFTGGTAGFFRGAAGLAAQMPIRTAEAPERFRSRAAEQYFADLLSAAPDIRCVARRGDAPELPETLPGTARFADAGPGIRLRPVNRMELWRMEQTR